MLKAIFTVHLIDYIIKIAKYDTYNIIGLCVHPTQEIFCTASYDGNVRIWDIRTKV